MWKSMDLKSLLIGGLTVLLVACALGDWPTGGGSVVLDSSFHGRFTMSLAAGPLGSVEAYILDTATGEVWEKSRGQAGEFYAPKILFAEPNEVYR